MSFRFDMLGKTPQQQAIVAKRDLENKQRQQEATERNEKNEKKKTLKDINTNILVLVIDKDNCPNDDSIISKKHCSGCEYYKDFILENEQQCVKCSNKLYTSKNKLKK